MKKALCIIAAVMTTAFMGMMAHAQAPLDAYEASPFSDATPHAFSGSAQTIGIQEGSDLHNLWLSPDTTLQLSTPGYGQAPAAQTGLPIGFDFPFGTGIMTHFGITGDGFIFFSNSEDIYPAVDLNSMLYTTMTDYLYFRFQYLSSESWGNQYFTVCDIQAGVDCSVQYESANDTLFVQFNNVVVIDSSEKTDKLVASWQYAFANNGNVSLCFLDMQPSSASNYAYDFGLVANRNSYVFLTAEGPETSTSTITHNSFNETTYPEANSGYTFSLPAPCAEVTEGRVSNWDFETTDTELSLGYDFAFEGSENLLLILSTEEILSDENLPVDGITYEEGDQIGSSAGVATGRIDSYGSALFSPSGFDGLESATTYYLHAFFYNAACSGGPLYNQDHYATQAVSTLLSAPGSISVESMTANSLTLAIENDPKAEGYLLAWSEETLPAYDFSLDGEAGYTDGQTVTINERTLHIVKANTTDQTVTVDGLEPGSVYYFYAWALRADGENVAYSGDYASLSAFTPAVLPATFSFENAETGSQAPGWNTTTPNRPFTVFSSGMYGDGPRYLGVTLVDYNMGMEDQVSLQADAISPAMMPLDYDSAVAYFDIRIFSLDSWSGEISPYAMAESDSMVFQYAIGESEDRIWHTIGKIDHETELNPDDYTTFTTASFPVTGDENVYVRAIAYHVFSMMDMTAPTFGINQLVVEPVLPCRKPADLAVVEDDLAYNEASLSWSDPNRPFADFFIQTLAEGDSAWVSYPLVSEEGYTLSGLTANTTYTARIQAVCGAGDSSLVSEIEFTTLQSIPFEEPLSNVETMPEGFLSQSGILADTGFSRLSDAMGYGWQATTDENYEPALGIYGTAMSDNHWLILPTLSAGNQTGTAELSFGLKGFYLRDGWELYDSTAFGQTDSVLVLASPTEGFNRSHVIGAVPCSELTDSVQRFAFDFEVNEFNHLALLFKSDEMVMTDNAIFLDSISVIWLDLACPAPTNLRSTGRTETTINLSWQGEATEFAVVYMQRNTEESLSDTLYTEDNTCSLTGLEPASSYAIHVFGFCGTDRTFPTEPSNTIYINTQTPCYAPTNLEVLDVTWQSVRLAVNSQTTNKEMNIWAQDADRYPTVNYSIAYTRDTTTFTSLYEVLNIPYYARTRAICAPGDTSEWSNTVEFTTLPVPVCGTPSNLAAEVDYDNLTADLTWTPGENNQYAYVFYREASTSQFDTTMAQEPDHFTLRNLRANTSYVWRLMGYCDNMLYSEDVESTFSTTPSANESVLGFGRALDVRAYQGQIIVENPSHLFIKAIQLYTPEGKSLGYYDVNSTENVFVRTGAQSRILLVKVYGENGNQATFKVLAW